MIVQELNGHKPKIGKDCFIAENAVIIGEVEIGDQCSIWYNAVVRGDVHYIKMGNKVNIQDGAVVHGTYKKSPTNIGDNVSVGHNAIVHAWVFGLKFRPRRKASSSGPLQGSPFFACAYVIAVSFSTC